LGRLQPQRAKGSARIAAPAEDFNSWNVSFTFHATEPGFGISDLSPTEKVEFFDAIGTRSRMTWQQLYNDHRGLGVHAIPRGQMRVAVPDILEGKPILSMYFGKGLRRLIGHRVNATER
jgi:hypothetical protein